MGFGSAQLLLSDILIGHRLQTDTHTHISLSYSYYEHEAKEDNYAHTVNDLYSKISLAFKEIKSGTLTQQHLHIN